MYVCMDQQLRRLDPQDKVFGVRCKHGPEECAGNVQQLCVAKYEPEVWWQFVQCQNFEGKDKVGNPDLALDCANTVGFDWEESKVGTCAGLDGNGAEPEGVALLKESLELSRKLGIEYTTLEFALLPPLTHLQEKLHNTH